MKPRIFYCAQEEDEDEEEDDGGIDEPTAKRQRSNGGRGGQYPYGLSRQQILMDRCASITQQLIDLFYGAL